MAGGFCDFGFDGVLTINPGGVGGTAMTLNNPAWDVPMLKTLLMEFAFRGDNLLLPQAAGRAALPLRMDQATHSLQLWVNGYVNQAGTAYTSTQTMDGTGMTTNLDTLFTNVFAPVVATPWTRGASWLMPNGTTRTAQVQFSPLRAVGNWDSREMLYQFTLTIPSGRFV